MKPIIYFNDKIREDWLKVLVFFVDVVYGHWANYRTNEKIESYITIFQNASNIC
jgi:hypothetical protein